MAKAAVRAKKKNETRYSPHPAIRMEAAGKAKILAATGKSFDEWVALARASGLKQQKTLSAWLRAEHGFASMNAYWLAATALGRDEPGYADPERLVDALYSGPKAALRPIHEKIVDVALACGDDVIATSCKTMVPIYRKHVFAEMRPVDGGVEAQMALGDGVPAKGRLLPADGRQPGDRLTHRVVVRSRGEVDAEFRGWLAIAYQHGAGKMARASSAETPDDLAEALGASAKARATWETCTPAMQRDFIQWIESAKQPGTRERRVAKSAANLAAGRRKNY